MTWAAFERGAYQAARAWDIQPSEFWGMSPWEWWMEVDMRIAEDRKIREARDKKPKPGAKFSTAEWEDARRRAAQRRASK